jgi:hypothetical protein
LTPLPTFPVPTPSPAAMTQPAPKREWKRWTPEDLELLADLAGEIPWHMVVEQFNQSRPPRTPKALSRQAEAMGLSIKPQGEFITTSAIGVLTGYNNKKILNWILSRKLKAVYRYKSKNNHWCISRKALWEFARKHPQQFGGIGHSELTQLFDSETRASEIVAMNLPRLKQTVEVECIETGQRYKSIKEASVAAFVNKSGISASINNGWAANGLHYRRVVKPPNRNLK